MVLLESSRKVMDPQARFLDLNEMFNITTTKWKMLDNGSCICEIQTTWINIQGPNGILSKLNKLGLVNGMTGEPFKILSGNEYREEIFKTTCVIL